VFLALCVWNATLSLPQDSKLFFGIHQRTATAAVAQGAPDAWRTRAWVNVQTGRVTASFETILGAGGDGDTQSYLSYAWYLVVGGNAARIAMIFATAVLLGGPRDRPVQLRVRRSWFPGRMMTRTKGDDTHVVLVDITALGKRSISNYLMHWYVFLGISCTYLGSATARYGYAKILTIGLIVVVQSNFWMAKPVYDVVRPIFLAPAFMDWLLGA